MSNADSRDNFKVVIKSRPLIKREKDKNLTSQWKIEGNCIECVNPLFLSQRYTFDHIYDENKTTQDLFDEVAKPIVEKSVKGFNGTIFAYGQTSSGKTFTMLGDKKNVGIIRLAARHIFNEIMQYNERTFIVKVNYLEIYNEKVYDLLDDRKEIKIQELPTGELKFGCTGKNVKTEDEILKWVDNGNNHRRVAETNMNVQSSRSHAILQIGIESVLDCDGASQVSVLNLVDLAGSERADSTGATGERLKEAGNINKSLLTLSIVINKLSEDPDERTHIGYRDSKLTRILANSLGGNALTCLICNITTAAAEETNLTLGFATRAKKIENKPIINETVSDAVEVKRAKKQIVLLEAQLANQRKEIAEYQKKELELKALKQITITIEPRKSNAVASKRRKTWAAEMDIIPPTTLSLSPLPKIQENTAENKPVCHMKFGDMGREIECSDADWGSLMNETLEAQFVDIDENEINTNMYKFPSRPELIKTIASDERSSVKTPHQNNKPARRSLLVTPKSLKGKWGKSNDSESQSTVASPIALDKDKRIRLLEDELEQARHFHQTESVELRSEVNEKSIEITTLNEQLTEAHQKISDIESRLETAERTSKEAVKEKQLANKAKELAEQVKASIEYEYEEHQNRAKRREKELVEQLDQLGNDDAMTALKQKLATITEKAKSLETQLWQDSQKHKDELENMNAKMADKLAEAQESIDRAAVQAEKFKTLQSEYDDTSSQLVDMIEENDQLKKQCIALNKEIEELNAKSKSASTLAEENADSEAKLQAQIQAHATEVQKLEEKYRKEMQSHEEIKTSLMAEIENLKKTIENHSSELKTLEDGHRAKVDGLTQTQTSTVEELEKDIEEQKKEIFEVKFEHNDLLAYCKNLEHSNTLLENAWAQARMTVDCIMKEMDVLRTGYNDLKMKTYEQELEHLKLQKTISEFDETINFSLFNDDTESLSIGNSISICNTPQIGMSKRRSMRNSNNKLSVISDSRKEDESKINDLTLQLKIANEERDKYSRRLESILKRLSNAADEKLSSSIEEPSIYETLLDKFVTSFYELKDLKDKCNLLENAKEKNEQLISSLKNELDRTEKDYDRVSSEIADLKIAIADSGNSYNNTLEEFVKSQRELNEKLAEKDDQLKGSMDEITQLKSIVDQYENMKNQALEKLHKNQHHIPGWHEVIANHEQSSKQDQNEQNTIELKKQLALVVNGFDRAINTISELKASSESLNSNNHEQIDKMRRELAEKLTQKDAELKSAMEEIVHLKAVADKFEQLKNETLEKLQKNEREMSELQEIIADNDRTKNEQQDELNKILRQLEEQATLKDKITSEITELKTIITNYENSSLSTQAELEKIQHELMDKNAQLKSSLDEIEQLKSIANQYDQLKNETHEKLHKNECKITELQEIIASHERSKEQNQCELNKIECELKIQLVLKEKDLDRAMGEISELKSNIVNIENSKRSIQEEFNTVQCELNEKLAHNDAELKKSTDEIVHLKSVADQYDQLKNETLEKLQKNERKITELQEIIADHERTKNQHQDQLNTVECELKNKLALKEKDLDQATSEISTLKSTIADLENSKRNVQEEFDKSQRELNEKLAQKDAELKSSKDEIAQLKSVADQYDQLKNETLETLQKNERKITEMKEVIADHEQAKKQQKGELNKIQSELEDLLAQKEKELLKASKEIAELKEVIANHERLKQQNQTKVNELKHQINVLEEEQECLEKFNKKLQNQVNDHDEEMKNIQGKLAIMKQSKEKIEFEKQKLVEEMNAIKNKRHVTLSSDSSQIHSPRRRDNRDVDVENLLKENRTLKSMQAVLESEVLELRKSTSTVRKIKRQSIHDDTRRISGFDSTMIDYGTQTDPTDEKCACGDMAKQIIKLKQDLVIIEAKYATFRLSTGVDELQAEVKTLKAELSATKTKLSRINIDYENLCDKHEKLKVKSAIASYKPSLSDAIVQTDASKTNPTFIDQIDFERINRKAEKYKKAYEEVVTNYNALKSKYENMKAELEEKSAKCNEAAKLLDEIQPKYANMKRICNHRWDEIEEFKKRIAEFEKNEVEMKSQLKTMNTNLAGFKETTKELVRFKQKYEVAKGICDNRRIEIERLNKLINAPNNENIPVNK